MSNEHVDNYLAEIERAKAELNTLNNGITKAKEEKQSIEQGNHFLLQEKLVELEHKKEEYENLKHDANHLHAKNSLLSDQLEKLQKEHAQNVDELVKSKENHALAVKNKEEEIQIRETSLKNIADSLNIQAKEIDGKCKAHEELSNQLMDQAKSNEILLNELKEQQSIIDAAIVKRTELIEELKLINEQVEAGKQSTYNDLLKAQTCLSEARSREQAAKDALEAVSVKEEGLKDLILQSKKEQIDAIKLSERATKKETEANIKIAELKELREAMAQQEK